MKNMHKFNHFKTNIVGYSKNIYEASEEQNTSSEETRKPSKHEVDILVERGTVADYCNKTKKRAERALDPKREEALLTKMEKLEALLADSTDTIAKLQETIEENRKTQLEETNLLRRTVAEQAVRISRLEKEKPINPLVTPDDISRLQEQIDIISNNKAINEVKAAINDLGRELYNFMTENRSALDELSRRIERNEDGLTQSDIIKESIKKLIEDLKRIKGKVDKLSNIEKLVRDLDDSIQDLADNGADLQRKFAKITQKLKQIDINGKELEKIENELSVIKDEVEKLKKRKPGTLPPLPPTDQPTGPDNDGIIDNPEKPTGIPAEHIATRVYEALKDEMGPGWKFNASYSHSKCWKYYNVRPGTQVTGKDRWETDKRYCVYDGKKYLYTEEWYKKLVRELPTEWEKIKKYRPIK